MEQDTAHHAVSPALAAAALDAATPAGTTAAAAAVPALAASVGASATAWGLLLALAAAAGNNIGKGLQKAATRGLPALTLARKEVWAPGYLLHVIVGFEGLQSTYGRVALAC